jgi:hypothetical protein
MRSRTARRLIATDAPRATATGECWARLERGSLFVVRGLSLTVRTSFRCEFSLLWTPAESSKAKKRRGERRLGSSVPPPSRVARARMRRQKHLAAGQVDSRCPCCEPLHCVEPGGALCRPHRRRRGCQQQRGYIWGVRRPPLPPPFFAPWSSWRGSLTPQMHVTFVRRSRALSVTPSSALRGSTLARVRHQRV